MTNSEARRARGGLTLFDVNWIVMGQYFLLVGSAWFALSGMLPFEPYRITGYQALPTEGCIGEPVELHLMRIAERPPLGWISTVDLDIRWQNINTGTTLVSSTPSDVFNGRYGPDEDAIGIMSAAPNEPGDWRIVTTAKIKGGKLFMPNETVITHQTERIYTLRPSTHEACKVASDEQQ